MVKDTPVTCSLGASELNRRLIAMAEIGASSLIASATEGGRHLLRFRADATTRERLEGIVAAEAECCPALALTLSKEGDDLVLSIAAPKDAQTLADELAGAFAATDE